MPLVLLASSDLVNFTDLTSPTRWPMMQIYVRVCISYARAVNTRAAKEEEETREG